MKKYYWIFGIIIVVAVVIAIFLSKRPAEPYVLLENPVVINKEMSGAPSSPMDLGLLINQFSNDKTSEITVKVGKRIGYKTEWFQAKNTKAEIQLPEGLELIEGNLVWEGDIIGEEVAEFKVKVKAVKNGEWVIESKAISNEFPGYGFVGDTETVYILVKDGEVLISDRSFTPISPFMPAEPVNP